MSHALSSAEIESALKKLPGWTYTEQALHKQFVCENFREAISFIVRLSFHAEELNHHPELKNTYNTVDIRLTTHDAGNQVTAHDVALAQAIEGFNWTSHA